MFVHNFESRSSHPSLTAQSAAKQTKQRTIQIQTIISTINYTHCQLWSIHVW